MHIITVVEGKVDQSKAKEFEENYATAKSEPLPSGFVSSSLLRRSDASGIYQIQTVWQSREALEKMRSSTQTPKAFELFKKVGVRPTLQIFNFVDTIP